MLISPWKRYGRRLFVSATQANLAQIRAALLAEHLPERARLLDLGCWDGAHLLDYTPPGLELHGVEGSAEAVARARSRGVDAVPGDLNDRLPFDDASFDVVTSNQVIEHVADTDRFVAESLRVLRPGGLVVASTENLASWHNIGALLFGWQAFSLANVSEKRLGLGNPVSLIRDEEPVDKAWQHCRVFSYRGLLELYVAHGFERVRVEGAGYYPFGAGLGRRDPRHAVFMTVVAHRPPS